MNIKSIINKIDKIISGAEKEPKKALVEIRAELELEVITNGKINTGIKSAYKDFKKSNNREKFNDLLLNQNGNFFLCNGYYYIEYEPEAVPTELVPYKKEDVKESLIYDNIYNKDTSKKATIKINDLKKIINYNKINKNDKIPFIVNDEYALNADYLMQIYKLTKIKEDFIYLEYGSCIAPANIKTPEDIKALILPIRLVPEDEKTKKTIEKFNEIIAC